MSAVIPAPAALLPESVFADLVAAARRAFTGHFSLQPNAAPASEISIDVSVTGVAHFESIHGYAGIAPDGIAPDGIALYPALSISFPS